MEVYFSIKAKTKPCHVHLNGFEYHFGFDYILKHLIMGSKTFMRQRPPDMTHGMWHFYIYCSLVKNIAVINKMLPILATIDATKGVYGEQVMHPVQYPLFVNCVQGPQQIVQVAIADMVSVKNLFTGITKLKLSVKDV